MLPGMIVTPKIVVPSLSFVTTAVNTGTLTTYTFSGVSIGAVHPFRTLVVGAAGRGNGAARTITSLTVDGNAMASVVASASQNCSTGLFRLPYPTGTSANFVLTFSGSCANGGIAVWALYDLASDSPLATAATNTDNDPRTIDVAAQGILIAYSAIIQVTPTATVTGFSKNFDQAVDAAQNTYHAGGSLLVPDTQAGRTVNVDWSGTPPVAGNVEALYASFR